MGRRRRSNFGVTNLLSDIVDDIRDFLDDEILDRGHDTELDVRRSGRSFTEPDEVGGARRPRARRSDADIVELRRAVRTLAEKVSALDA